MRRGPVKTTRPADPDARGWMDGWINGGGGTEGENE
jgi:hypothetical protein